MGEGQSRWILWVSFFFIALLLPLCLYIPFLLAGAIGGTPIPKGPAAIIYTPSALGWMDGSQTDEIPSGSLRVTGMAAAQSIAKGKKIPTDKPVYIITDDVTASFLSSSNLVTSPSGNDGPSGSGSGPAVGIIVYDDPLCLMVKKQPLAQAGLLSIDGKLAKNINAWQDVAEIETKLSNSISPQAPLVACDDLFTTLLYQHRGRISDSTGQPTFHFGAGQAALSQMVALLNPKKTTYVPWSVAALKSFSEGRASMMVGKLSAYTKITNSLPRSSSADIAILPLPQMSDGIHWVGGSRTVLTMRGRRYQPMSVETSSQYFATASSLAKKFSASKPKSWSTGEQITPELVSQPPPGDLVYLAKHQSVLKQAILASLMGGIDEKTALSDAASKCRTLADGPLQRPNKSLS